MILPNVRRIFVDGGFSKNEMYMTLLADAFLKWKFSRQKSRRPPPSARRWPFIHAAVGIFQKNPLSVTT